MASPSASPTVSSSPSTSTSPSPTPKPVSLTKVSQLRDAPIPASCEHKATHLHGFKRLWDKGMRGTARLSVKDAVFTHLTGGPTDVVVPMVCTAGNADWPDYLLAYAPGARPSAPARLLGSWWLAKSLHNMEHADLKSLSLVNGTVTARGIAYNGAGFNLTNWSGTVGWAHGKVAANIVPLTIDYISDQSNPAMGANITSLKYLPSTLAPAPPDFVAFIKRRYKVVSAQFHGCQPEVDVTKFSHLGFASGDEGSCGGVETIWAKAGGRWRLVVGFNGDINCSGKRSGATDPALLHRALEVLPVSCATHGGRKFTTLAHWPASAE